MAFGLQWRTLRTHLGLLQAVAHLRFPGLGDVHHLQVGFCGSAATTTTAAATRAATTGAAPTASTAASAAATGAAPPATAASAAAPAAAPPAAASLFRLLSGPKPETRWIHLGPA